MAKKKRKLARHLRNNMTLPEVLLWNQIKNCQIGFDFNRQFCLGPYIADFYCRAFRLVVEVDGQVHELKHALDQDRDTWLADQGYVLFRVSAKSVLRSPNSVAQMVQDRLVQLQTYSDPSGDTSF